MEKHLQKRFFLQKQSMILTWDLFCTSRMLDLCCGVESVCTIFTDNTFFPKVNDDTFSPKFCLVVVRQFFKKIFKIATFTSKSLLLFKFSLPKTVSANQHYIYVLCIIKRRWLQRQKKNFFVKNLRLQLFTRCFSRRDFPFN